MLKLSGSFCKLLFATLLVFFCLNGQQLVYAEAELNKETKEVIVEVPKVSQATAATSGAANPSTVTHSFDLKFDVGEAKDYPVAAGKSFDLAIGKSCNLKITITQVGTGANKQFVINNDGVTNLQKLTITNEKIISTPGITDGSKDLFLCDPKRADSGGSIKLETPANDSEKSTIELKITGDGIKDLPDGFKLTSTAQVYKAAGEDSSSGGLSTGAVIGIVIGVMVVTALVGGVVAFFVVRYIKKKKNNENYEMNDEPEKPKESKRMSNSKEKTAQQESSIKKTTELKTDTQLKTELK